VDRGHDARHRMTNAGEIGVTWRAILARWRGLTHEEIRAAYLLTFALVALNLVMFMRRLDVRWFLDFAVNIPANFALVLTACFTLLLGIVTADVIGNTAARRLTLVLAVIISGLLISMLEGLQRLLHDFSRIGVYVLLLGLIGARAVKGRAARRSIVAFAIAIAAIPFGLGLRELADDPHYIEALRDAFGFARWVFYQWLLLAGAATFAYLDWRRTRGAQQRMHAAEVDRARSARHALESRLQAMQARVEPQFLFNTLTQVRDLYRSDAVQGERMLDELIAYLRAAMPKMRDTSSTVRQEIELGRAYLAIVSLRPGGRLAYEIELPDALVAEARMPPMMLLPLLDHAIGHRFVEPGASEQLRIRTGIAEGSVRLEVSASGGELTPRNGNDAIDGIRERLAALYGEEATLDLREGKGGATEAVLEFPFEPKRQVAKTAATEERPTEPMTAGALG